MTALIVDGNNLLMRAIFAMARSGLSDHTGAPTGPLLVFINTLSKHVIEERPERLVVCWDSDRSQRRTLIDEWYKSNRSSPPEVARVKVGAFALAKEFLTLAGVHHVERRGAEADDLIAHYWRHRPSGAPCVILSSDKDFLQLLDKDTQQVRLSSSGTPTDRWTADRVRDEYGCDPRCLSYVLALAGDVSDGVVGLPRVGVKTAVKRLRQHDFDWGALLASLPDEQSQQAARNLLLVDLREEYEPLPVSPTVPLFEPTSTRSQALPGLRKFLAEHDLRSVRDRLTDGVLWGDTPKGRPDFQ